MQSGRGSCNPFSIFRTWLLLLILKARLVCTVSQRADAALEKADSAAKAADDRLEKAQHDEARVAAVQATLAGAQSRLKQRTEELMVAFC